MGQPRGIRDRDQMVDLELVDRTGVAAEVADGEHGEELAAFDAEASPVCGVPGHGRTSGSRLFVSHIASVAVHGTYPLREPGQSGHALACSVRVGYLPTSIASCSISPTSLPRLTRHPARRFRSALA